MPSNSKSLLSLSQTAYSVHNICWWYSSFNYSPLWFEVRIATSSGNTMDTVPGFPINQIIWNIGFAIGEGKILWLQHDPDGAKIISR